MKDSDRLKNQAVLEAAVRLERLLVAVFGASGGGLGEKRMSVEHRLTPELNALLLSIAQDRNFIKRNLDSKTLRNQNEYEAKTAVASELLESIRLLHDHEPVPVCLRNLQSNSYLAATEEWLDVAKTDPTERACMWTLRQSRPDSFVLASRLTFRVLTADWNGDVRVTPYTKSESQEWTLHPHANGSYSIASRMSGHCLDSFERNGQWCTHTYERHFEQNQQWAIHLVLV